MRSWFRRAHLWAINHQQEISLGVTAFSITMIVKREVGYHFMHRNFYLHISQEDLKTLASRDTPGMSFDLTPRNHLHILKLIPPKK